MGMRHCRGAEPQRWEEGGGLSASFYCFLFRIEFARLNRSFTKAHMINGVLFITVWKKQIKWHVISQNILTSPMLNLVGMGVHEIFLLCNPWCISPNKASQHGISKSKKKKSHPISDLFVGLTTNATPPSSPCMIWAGPCALFFLSLFLFFASHYSGLFKKNQKSSKIWECSWKIFVHSNIFLILKTILLWIKVT